MRKRFLLAGTLLVLLTSSAGVAPARQSSLQRFYFDRYSMLFPTSYTPQQLGPGDPGCYLIRTSPFAFVFVAMQRQGEDSVVPQGRAVLGLMLARLSMADQVMNQSVTDIPPSELKPPTTMGKLFNATTSRGLELEARFYLAYVSGRKVLVGYATLTGQNVPQDLQGLLTTDPASVAAEFDQMAASIRLEQQ